MAVTKQYRNSFYRKGEKYSREFYNENLVENYRGYEIHEYHSSEFHIVKDGVCIHMYAGKRGARKKIDELVGNVDDIYFAGPTMSIYV